MAKRRLGPNAAALTRVHRIPARGDRPSGSTAQARCGPRRGLFGGRPGNWICLAGAVVLVGLALGIEHMTETGTGSATAEQGAP